MMYFIRRERIYFLMVFFVIAVNFLQPGRIERKPVEEKKALSSMTFSEMGVSEQKVRDYLASDKPSARLFRRGMASGIFIFILSIILNILLFFFRKRPFAIPPGHRSPVLWGIGDLLRASLVIIFLSYIAAIIQGFICKGLHIDMGLNLRMMLNTFIIDIAVAMVVLYYVAVKHKEQVQALGLRSSSFFRNILSGITVYIFALPFLLVVLLLSIFVLNSLGYVPPPQPVFEVFMEEKRSNVLIFLTVFVSVLGPVVEEIFFRGFMYSAIKKRFGIISAVLLSASIFSLLHANIVGFLPIMILGVLLAYLYETTGSLVSSITVHIIHNSIIVSFVFFVKELMG